MQGLRCCSTTDGVTTDPGMKMIATSAMACCADTF